MKKTCLLLLLSLNIFAFDKCLMILEDRTRDLCVEVEWPQGLKERQFKTINLKFTDLTSGAAMDPDFAFFPYVWMYMDNGVEHGSRSLKVQRKAVGFYQLSGIYLIPMKGYWSFQIALSETAIPAGTKIPNYQNPKPGKLFLGKYLIKDQARVRLDFLKFSSVGVEAFLVWNDLPAANTKNQIRVYFQLKDTVVKLEETVKGSVQTNKTVLPIDFKLMANSAYPFHLSDEFMIDDKNFGVAVFLADEAEKKILK